MAPKTLVHARHPNWAGPLCQYSPETCEALVSTFVLSESTDHGDVSCRACRRMMFGGITIKEGQTLIPVIPKTPPGRVLKPRRWPRKLPLKPDAPWTGHLTVKEPSPGLRLYPVAFDARTKATPNTFVYDLTMMTAEQIKSWTNIDVEAGEV